MNEGRIAIIAIGNSPVFLHLYSIADSLSIPYISIKWESLEEENSIIARANMLFSGSYNHDKESDYDEDTKINQINIHPPANTLMNAIIDLVHFYKWEYVTILFQESTGLGRIEDLIRMPSKTSSGIDTKIRLQIRQLGTDVDKWIYLIKDVKLSGSCHIIVDIQTKYLDTFLEQANEVGLMTTYFHFMFTTLDLSELDYVPSANITALQMFEINDPEAKRLQRIFDLKNMELKKPTFKYLPVCSFTVTFFFQIP